MNCQEALELLYDIIDKEASEIDQEQFRAHLKQCQDCFDVYKLEESFQAFVDEKLSAAKSIPKLDRLKANILSELDSIDLEQNKVDVPRRFGYTSWTFVAAASLIITVGAAFFTSDMIRHYAKFSSLENAHLEPASASASDISPAEIIRTVEGQFGYALGMEIADFKLERGYFEELKGVEMAHLVYTNNGQRVSVFVALADGFEIPDDKDNIRVLNEGKQFVDHRCEGCRLVFHVSGKAVIITATTDESIELLSFIPGRRVL